MPGQDGPRPPPPPLESFTLLLFPLHLLCPTLSWLIIQPSLIVPLSRSNNRPICPSSLAPASPPAALFSPLSALQWQVLIRELPRPLCYSSSAPLPAPATFNLITGFPQPFRRRPDPGGQWKTEWFHKHSPHARYYHSPEEPRPAPPASGPCTAC